MDEPPPRAASVSMCPRIVLTCICARRTRPLPSRATAKGLENLVERLARRLDVSLVVLEATGGFETTVRPPLSLARGYQSPSSIRADQRLRPRPWQARQDRRHRRQVIAIFAEKIRPQARRSPRKRRKARRTGARDAQIVEMIAWRPIAANAPPTNGSARSSTAISLPREKNSPKSTPISTRACALRPPGRDRGPSDIRPGIGPVTA